jgi:hypothetical protein
VKLYEKSYRSDLRLHCDSVILLIIFHRQLAVVENGATDSFEALFAVLPVQFAEDGGWELTAPDGSVYFLWNSGSNGKQDKDLVFVLDPQPLITAGVDPHKVNGWSYSLVRQHINGRYIDVWRFVKPFDLH